MFRAVTIVCPLYTGADHHTARQHCQWAEVFGGSHHLRLVSRCHVGVVDEQQHGWQRVRVRMPHRPGTGSSTCHRLYTTPALFAALLVAQFLKALTPLHRHGFSVPQPCCTCLQGAVQRVPHQHEL